ncbi:hypothetical protein NCER_100140 [Vairimorpha ceranae BRL01]|uniref:Transcriptional activator HAP2 n=1 Tax=Vairimorpha ceranae (strain BRL01) TaxID=578460 RepID=C4V6U4_VAIC1|nr:hypothetical protein NCER_100140 [Vairimorpha ceranae BRL01]
MKRNTETKNEKIYKDWGDNSVKMPHLNSSNSSNFNNNEGKLSYHEMQNKPDGQNFDNMYSYGYYDDHGSQPIYVNIKQLSCIQKRKARREYLDTLMAEHKNNYLHESRHRHAMQRKRAPTGRYLTKEESRKLNEQGENNK